MFIAAIIPNPPGPSLFGQFDKVEHIVEYLLFAWLIARAIRVTRGRHGTRTAWVGAAGYGALMEVVQLAVPWRSADLIDFLSDLAGALLGAWLERRLDRSGTLGRPTE